MFRTIVIASAMPGASFSSSAFAQAATNGNFPRADYDGTIDTDFRKLDTNKDGQISLIEHRAGKLSYFDQIDSDKDGVVSVAEMKAAGVIK